MQYDPMMYNMFENDNVFIIHSMNRLFGNARPKGPAPNLTDSIANLDSRGDSVEKKIQKLDVSIHIFIVSSFNYNITINP